jgi:hypothetical protein
LWFKRSMARHGISVSLGSWRRTPVAAPVTAPTSA